MLKVFLGLVLILTMGLSADANPQQGSYHLDVSDPAVLQIFHPNSWSNIGTWDIDFSTSIPPQASIRYIRITWEILSEGNKTGLEVKLKNEKEDEFIFLFNNQRTKHFKGESPFQDWSVKFRVENWENPGRPLQLKITNFVIGWEIEEE